jgi:hypothetical protein
MTMRRSAIRSPRVVVAAIFLLVACVVGAVCASGLLGRKMTEPEAVIQLYSSSRRVLVMMRIGDHPPAPVVFDTGTNDNILDTAYAKAFNLPRTGPSTSIDGSRGLPVPGYQTWLKEVRLGGAVIADAPANVFDYRNTDEVGVFGPNSFPGKLVLLDLRRGELRILPRRARTSLDGPGTPYIQRGTGGLPSLPLALPGMTVDAILDSGNDSALLLPLHLADRLPLNGRLKEIGKVVSASGDQPVYQSQIIGKVRIGPVTLDNPPVRFIKGGHPNVGLPILRQMSLVFDPTDGRTWVVGDSDTDD